MSSAAAQTWLVRTTGSSPFCLTHFRALQRAPCLTLTVKWGILGFLQSHLTLGLYPFIRVLNARRVTQVLVPVLYR